VLQQIVYQSGVFRTAQFWLDLGAALIPIQPDTKRIVAGFGRNQKRITTLAEARQWFDARRCNIAVVIPSGLYCVDFDSWAVYGHWRGGPGAYVQTLIERTRRGAHVWFRGGIAEGTAVECVEIKRAGAVVTVAPSVVAGVRYAVLTDYPIAEARAEQIATIAPSPLSKIPGIVERLPASNAGLMARLKVAYSCIELAEAVTALRPSPGGRYFVGPCPFHKDTARHFWVDSARNLWGCHSGGCPQCGAHDAVNLYAAIEHLTNEEAIKAMAEKLPAGDQGARA